MPKKKNPQLAKLQAQAESKQFFDSADYEVKRAQERNPALRQQMREEAMKAPHATAQK